MAENTVHTGTTPAVTTSTTTLDPSTVATESTSRAESFVSAPSSTLGTQGSTPATTVSSSIAQEKDADRYQVPTDGPLKTVVSRPLESAIPRKPTPLTAEQQAKYDEVLSAVKQWTTIPDSTLKTAKTVPLEDHERMWLTRECLLRYLRATKWNTAQALKRLQSSLSWRREYGADKFAADYISPEAETGKQVLVGYDVEGRPCWYMTPSRQNTDISDRQIHQVSYMLDRAVELMPPGQETICLLISFKGSSRGGTVPSVSIGRQALNVLQNHNPERLGRALLIDMPWFVSGFMKLISPFIDPLTREKMVFDPKLREYVPGAHLINWYDGDLKFDYEHDKYWPSLTEETAKRRKAYLERWEAGGKSIGENEAYLRGGDVKPVRDETAQSTLVEGVSKLDVAA
ncbi:hypothetical protein AMS68_000378 [Peltaster fructicola]|uniref:CRAL-TRIO domain-containing protein n=1 Tax=Peltaster fructicola TaxID=286661 RepID=A0A6H0XJP1_9PEZI|nr:hypothetical protein AMS68_000378 [Peltaster fructicola]